MNRKIIGVLFVFFIFPGVTGFNINVQAEITTIASAINKSGRQRMLTQRMLKNYAMIGIHVQPEESTRQLKKAIELYNLQLSELKAFSPNNKITQSLAVVNKLWSPYEKILLKPVSRKNAEWLLQKNDELLVASHRVVILLQEASATNFGKLVNISGRQRMLSQRLAKFYMLKAWEFDNPELQAQSDKAKTEFEEALHVLMAARENSAEIKLALNEAKQQWDLFKYGLERNTERLVPLIVAMTSEKLLLKMNEITGMYEKLSER